jgi:hypothetical protein
MTFKELYNYLSEQHSKFVKSKHPYSYWKLLYNGSTLGVFSTDIFTKTTDSNYRTNIFLKDIPLEQLKEQSNLNNAIWKLMKYEKRLEKINEDFM